MGVSKFNTAIAIVGQGANLLADPICNAWPYVNANEFIFTQEALKKSYQTMENMPFNFMHDEKNILGHVSKAWTGEKQVDVAGKPAQCVAVSSTVVFYDHIFPELFDKISRGQVDDRFKVSVEAGFKDFKWALYDKNQHERSMESIPEGSNEDLDFLGFWGLLFGTFAGIEYNGKQMACLMAPDSNEIKFVGLALTDELNGAAADQNTDLTVLGSPKFLTCSGKNGFAAVKINKMMAAVVSGKSIDDVAKAHEYDKDSLVEMIKYASDPVNREKIELMSKNFTFAKFTKSTAADTEQPSNKTEEPANANQVPETNDGLHILDQIASRLEDLASKIEAGEKLSIAYTQIDLLEKKNEDQLSKIIELTKCFETTSSMLEATKAELESMKSAVAKHDIDVANKLDSVVADYKNNCDAMKDELVRLRLMELTDLGMGAIASSNASEIREMDSVVYSAKKEEWKRLASMSGDSIAGDVVLLDSDDPKFFEKLAKKTGK